jgi:hypothetical protein
MTMTNEELINEDISKKEMGRGSNPLILLGIVIFLIIVIIIGSVVRTGSFW